MSTIRRYLISQASDTDPVDTILKTLEDPLPRYTNDTTRESVGEMAYSTFRQYDIPWTSAETAIAVSYLDILVNELPTSNINPRKLAAEMAKKYV